ncbi:MAG: hypothetical protein HYZ54_02185 [Ignavibacteriae bacterium]|nr:hypothetical protein [Ignavibacteriota bacterium]
MKLREIKLMSQNHFIGMEYYYLILNRTFLIIKTHGYLIGIQGNGLISAEVSVNPITEYINSTLTIKEDLSDPYSYIKNSYIKKIKELDLLDGSHLKINKHNFLISTLDIKSAIYNPSKKFGMGNYPHDGRVIIETSKNVKREFIILGDQSGYDISKFILAS